MKKVYRVYVNNKLFIKTINKLLAEKTARSAQKDYGLKAEVRKSSEEYKYTATDTL